MPFVLLALLLPLLLIVLIPVAIVRRYQVGTSRQRARGWLAAINIAGLALSSVLVLASAAVMTYWVPDALGYTAGGLAAGAMLGLAGLRLTRWERTPSGLHYTPNRLLLLGITLVVSARILYGVWRMWESWRRGVAGESWFVEAGLEGSFAAGAVVLGYYLVYWIGGRRRAAGVSRGRVGQRPL